MRALNNPPSGLRNRLLQHIKDRHKASQRFRVLKPSGERQVSKSARGRAMAQCFYGPQTESGES